MCFYKTINYLFHHFNIPFALNSFWRATISFGISASISQFTSNWFWIATFIKKGNSGINSPKLDITTNHFNKIEYEIVKASLTGKERYNIEKSSERTLSLEHDNISGFNAKKIFHKLKIQIHFDEQIEFVLNKSGTLHDFVMKKSKPGFREYYFEGLIYPEQGYYIVLKIKS